MQDDSLLRRIKSQIEKRGFPLELRVAEALAKFKYKLNHQFHFYDELERKYLRVSIKALKEYSFKINEETFHIRKCILVQCKKSKKPWVILSTPVGDGDRDTLMVPYLPKVSFIDFTEYQQSLKIHPFSKYRFKGRSYFEAFQDSGEEEKKNEDGGVIFNTAFTAVKSTLFLLKKGLPPNDVSVCFYYPIIVYSGRLFQGILIDGKVNAEEVDSAIISFLMDPNNSQHDRFTVPIIKEEALPEFLSDLDKVLEFYGEIAHKRPNMAFPWINGGQFPIHTNTIQIKSDPF